MEGKKEGRKERGNVELTPLSLSVSIFSSRFLFSLSFLLSMHRIAATFNVTANFRYRGGRGGNEWTDGWMDRESVRRETILLIADDKKAGIFVAEYAEYSDFLKYIILYPFRYAHFAIIERGNFNKN